MRNFLLFTALLLFTFTSKLAHTQSNSTIKFNELPQSVQQDIKVHYKKYTLNSVEKVKLNKTGTEVYRVEVQKKTKVFRLTYDEKGLLIDKNKRKAYSFTGPDENNRTDGEDGVPIPTL